MVVRELLVTLGIKSDKGSFNKANGGIKGLVKSAMSLRNAFVGGLVAQGFKSLVEAASDGEERLNKFNAVFGASAGVVGDAMTDIENRTGQTSEELSEFAANIGALVKPALGSAEAAGKVAANVAELALDIASFNNVDPDQALRALRSGLIGSAEPLQQFGVDVRNSALDAVAAANGLGKSFKDLSSADKVQVRLAAINKQLKEQGALGDAALTADGLANSSRALGGQLKRIAELIGGFLLPTGGKLVFVLRDIAAGISVFVATNKELIQSGIDRFLSFVMNVMGALADVVMLAVNGFMAFFNTLSAVGQNLVIVSAVLIGLIALLGLPAVLLTAIGAAILLVVEDLKVMGEGGNSVIGTLIDGFNDLLEEAGGVGGAIGEALITAFDFWSEEVLGITKNTSEAFKQFFVDSFNDVVDLVSFLPRKLGEALGLSSSTVLQILNGDFAEGLQTFTSGASALFGGDSDGLNIGGGTINGIPSSVSAAAGAVANVATNAVFNITGGEGQNSVEIGRAAADRLDEQSRRDRRAAMSNAGARAVF